MDKCICGRCDELKVDQTEAQIISGALFDYVAHLWDKMGNVDAAILIDALVEFAAKRGLSLDDADVLNWHLQSTPLPEIPEKTVVLPVSEHIDVIITEEED